MDGTVLLLDYSKLEREKVKLILDNIGNFNVREISSLNEFTLYQDKPEAVSLIVMDIAFPTEKDGFDVLALLRKHPKTKNVHIIVTTKMVQMEDREMALKHSVSDYIVKPYQSARLENSIRSLIKLEKRFAYTVDDVNNVNMSFEDFISRELKMADRIKKSLSIILITTIRSKEDKLKEVPHSAELKKKVYNIAIEKAKLSLRSTDCAVLNRESDILLLLPFTDSEGARTVMEKIKNNLTLSLQEINAAYDDFFYSVHVTFPRDGKDFQALMESAFQKIENKEMLERIAAVSSSILKDATRTYRKFSR